MKSKPEISMVCAVTSAIRLVERLPCQGAKGESWMNTRLINRLNNSSRVAYETSGGFQGAYTETAMILGEIKATKAGGGGFQ